jgi:ABC-2 type transport system ATP-binding protein
MIEVSHLSRFYADFPAVDDVSFTVSAGEIIGLLGLNGAGKSTTLKVLAGLIPPSSGTVRVDGVDIVADASACHARIGYLPEDPPLYTDMTVEAFVRHIGRLKGMSAADVEARLPAVLATAQLTERRKQVIDTLSHGYRKRVGIAQAIIHDPKLIILDEPISGLDPVQIVEMRKVIRGLAAGRAVLVSSHILSEIEQTCDRIFVIRGGKLVAQGTEEELTSEVRRTGLRVVVAASGPAVGDGLVAWLRAHPAVASAEAAHASKGEVAALVNLKEDARERLVADLVGAGFGIRGLGAAQDALEELFLGLNKPGVA